MGSRSEQCGLCILCNSLCILTLEKCKQVKSRGENYARARRSYEHEENEK